MKLVCLSPRLTTEEKVEKQFLNTRYTKPLISRGINTVMLTLDNPEPEKVLEICDGFLITGGTDIDPSYYQESNEEGLSKGIDKRLDELDKLMVEHAVKYKKPLLGICRGHQSLNVFLGGTLHQDLATKNETHKRVKEDHFVNVQPHPWFSWDTKLNVNSYHHQAIKELADDLTAIAHHEDKTIEMVVHKSLPLFGVQWHPEINHESKESVVIFDAFKKLLEAK